MSVTEKRMEQGMNKQKLIEAKQMKWSEGMGNHR